MQIRDVENLLLSLKNLDKEYINERIQTLKLDAIYQQVKQY